MADRTVPGRTAAPAGIGKKRKTERERSRSQAYAREKARERMEARLAILTERTDRILDAVNEMRAATNETRADMKDLLPRVAVIEQTMAKKGFVVTVVLVALAVIAALVAFQDAVQAFIS